MKIVFSVYINPFILLWECILYVCLNVYLCVYASVCVCVCVCVCKRERHTERQRVHYIP